VRSSCNTIQPNQQTEFYRSEAYLHETYPQQRSRALDLFDPANGYNPAANAAQYSEAFTRKFFVAQAARNAKLVAAAHARLSAIEQGQGKYKAATKDKQIAYVEGASHGFTPCRPGYGDTMKRTLDHIDRWLRESGRFATR
jgi:hypothetical protein